MINVKKVSQFFSENLILAYNIALGSDDFTSEDISFSKFFCLEAYALNFTANDTTIKLQSSNDGEHWSDIYLSDGVTVAQATFDAGSSTVQFNDTVFCSKFVRASVTVVTPNTGQLSITLVSK